MNAQSWLDRLPSQCRICASWPARPICAPCRAQHIDQGARCVQCAIRLTDAQLLHGPQHSWRCGQCLQTPPPWRLGWTAVSYDAPWSALLGAFKFRGDVGLARSLAQLMHLAPGAAHAVACADALVPIPLTQAGFTARGFNQSVLLARSLAAQKVLPALARNHAQRPQHEQSRAQRLRNMHDAFTVVQSAGVAGKQVVLIDDVMTTGATLTAASQCLLNAGARRLDVLVFARTEREAKHWRDNRAPPSAA